MLTKLSNSSLNPQSVVGVGGVAGSSDMVFLYDADLQENCSFAAGSSSSHHHHHHHNHHMQQSTAGSTSLSSYSASKKEKKKRRSSSLKELMNTIQNSISKLRRRSASEKNDKTTCSIVTCSSVASTSTNCAISLGDTTSCSSSRYICDDMSKTTKSAGGSGMMMIHDAVLAAHTPFVNKSSSMMHASSSHQANMMGAATPICASLYTPRINKRNADDNLQSTTKKYV